MRSQDGRPRLGYITRRYVPAVKGPYDVTEMTSMIMITDDAGDGRDIEGPASQPSKPVENAELKNKSLLRVYLASHVTIMGFVVGSEPTSYLDPIELHSSAGLAAADPFN